MAHKLFIGGLPFSTSSDRLREVFAQAGGVESATVVMEQDTGRSRGFGFVEMTTAEEAEAAVKKFNGQDMDGRTLKVELAKSSGSGGGGYRSGGRQGRYFGLRKVRLQAFWSAALVNIERLTVIGEAIGGSGPAAPTPAWCRESRLRPPNVAITRSTAASLAC